MPVCECCKVRQAWGLRRDERYVCSACGDEGKPYELFNKGEALRAFMLKSTDIDLWRPRVKLVLNPVSPMYAPMQLYLRKDLELVEDKVWGGREKVLAEYAKKEAKRQARVAKEDRLKKRKSELLSALQATPVARAANMSTTELKNSYLKFADDKFAAHNESRGELYFVHAYVHETGPFTPKRQEKELGRLTLDQVAEMITTWSGGVPKEASRPRGEVAGPPTPAKQARR